jgi:RNA polymerase sigma-70 factor (ECF subfamily)
LARPIRTSAQVEALERSGAVQRELVEHAADGERDAFEALVRGSADRLYAIAYRILRDPDRAEDALQQTLIDIWDDLPDLRDPERFEAWSCRMLIRNAYRVAGRERRDASIRQISVLGSRDDGFARVVSRDEIEKGFRRLTPEHRAVLVLHYWMGLPVTEIADTLGIPLGTAASRLHHATRDLRAACEADARGVAWEQMA